ncbi:MAG: hypothetical protein M3460_16835 [Actinomycetota bacterium]|nr:hypothetical protein [Actinomycetota bacterium]
MSEEIREEVHLEIVPEIDVMPALSKANALAHNPFAWNEDPEETEQP